MRLFKTLLLIVMIGFMAQIGWAQGGDVFNAERTEPAKSVRLFPNPAVDFLSIKFETPQARAVHLTLHTIIGNSLEVDKEIVDDFEVRVKVKDLPTGYYLLAIKDDSGQRSSFKFLKR